MKKIALITAIAAAASVSFAAQANTTNFDVTVEVAESCEVTATAMTFLAVNPNNGVDGNDGNGTLTVTCTNGTTYSIQLAYNILTHTDTVTTLAYALYSDLALTNVWTAEPLEVVSDTGSGVAQTFDVFAGVNADPTILVGTYSDTVAVTVDF